jgi:hypothetical protein
VGRAGVRAEHEPAREQGDRKAGDERLQDGHPAEDGATLHMIARSRRAAGIVGARVAACSQTGARSWSGAAKFLDGARKAL